METAVLRRSFRPRTAGSKTWGKLPARAYATIGSATCCTQSRRLTVAHFRRKRVGGSSKYNVCSEELRNTGAYPVFSTGAVSRHSPFSGPGFQPFVMGICHVCFVSLFVEENEYSLDPDFSTTCAGPTERDISSPGCLALKIPANRIAFSNPSPRR